MSKNYTVREEIMNGITHGLGILFGIIALIVLLISPGAKESIAAAVSFGIYGVCIIIMYSASTLYHSFRKEKVKKVLRVFDHSSIFLFIAGTYTPVVMLTLQGPTRIWILVGTWLVAISGIIFKIVTYGKFDRYKVPSLILYIGMGWMAIIPIKAIIEATSWGFFGFILAGGLLYTIGTVFYSIKRIPYNHAIWHLFVLAASISHFIGIGLYLA
ncbi:PAQR family membrane homeostasis protein TrhA [Gudongella sp. SC589]|jgi:hemolysin III|uniref:PAQR family membrane homeostasis protein TrhA n=1 Tax=Gudongella sp. SC589 TaxID=3385990 RepID=UPI003904ACE3